MKRLLYVALCIPWFFTVIPLCILGEFGVGVWQAGFVWLEQKFWDADAEAISR